MEERIEDERGWRKRPERTLEAGGAAWKAAQQAMGAAVKLGAGAVTQSMVKAGTAGVISTAGNMAVQNIDFTKIGSSEWFNTEGFVKGMSSAQMWGNIAGGQWSIEWTGKKKLSRFKGEFPF